MQKRTLTYGNHNWYVTFENEDKVVALIPRKIEQTASNMALAYGARFAPNAGVTLRKIHPRGKAS